ncbi:MAG TPA: hypothetical protein P5119_00720 [Candidatus Aminicenantes bacterium]|nr:hypothetical protein [Candidatus Aminicenantes bacterium]HRY63846.1 hypothetical protein [Candidatus Aminicenantes bacterium]HRZ70759.1 hypothetical protein [Candidatus Aminicenantes bacterium]
MKPELRLGGACLALAAALTLAAAAAGRERILFKSLPPADPARRIIQAVLDSPRLAPGRGPAASPWKGPDIEGAWRRARSYFPASAFLVRPGTYFMTHGFDAGGRLFMEIHESAYLALCVENLGTFAPDAIVGEYGRMLGAANGREAAAFREKVGRLERCFRDEASNRSLRKALGGDLYARLLDGLRREDYHMLAGGLVHEGTHAGLDDALVARLQTEFGAGRRPVQWDELGAFMAEIVYHAPLCVRAADDIAGGWRRIEARLGGLEGLRRSRGLPAGASLTRFEKARTGAWAEAALVRLRLREIWQSAGRVQDLAAVFRKDYVGDGVPPDVGALLDRLDRDAAGFAASAGEAIGETEALVRSLEEVLDAWGEWASGGRPFPPPVTDSRALAKRAGSIRWPEPDAGAAAALLTRAGEELSREKASWSGGLRRPTFSPRPGSGRAS